MPRALIALTALAAALRLPTLGSQSLWLDEALTGRLARGSLGDLLHRVADEEANPPLFYLLEWAWTRVAGTSEVALRLPSALFGIALVPVAYAIGRRLGGPRPAIALAALVAVHPLLVYYSQEARGYAAVALATALGFAAFLDALEGRRRASLWWALASAIALGCHYFAIFPVAIEAAILLARRGRAVLPALGGLALAGAALLPLLTEQLGGEHGDNVTAGAGLAERVKAAATSWLVGERGAAVDNLEWLAGALLLGGVVLVVVRRERAAILPAAVGGGAAALIGLAALAGADYLNNRNTLPVLTIALAVPALGFAINRLGRRPRRRGLRSHCPSPPIGALTDHAHAREDWARRRATSAARGRSRSCPPSARQDAALVPPGARAGPAGGRRGDRARRRPQRPRAQPRPAGRAANGRRSPGFTPAGTRTARPAADRPLPRPGAAARPPRRRRRMGPHASSTRPAERPAWRY